MVPPLQYLHLFLQVPLRTITIQTTANHDQSQTTKTSSSFAVTAFPELASAPSSWSVAYLTVETSGRESEAMTLQGNRIIVQNSSDECMADESLVLLAFASLILNAFMMALLP